MSATTPSPQTPGALPPIPPTWTPAEQWAWGEILAGRAADFNARLGIRPDPSQLSAWQSAASDRQLSPNFLETILSQPFSKVAPGAVSITGAWITGHVSITDADLPGFHIDESRFDGHTAIWRSTFAEDVSLSSSWFGERLWLRHLTLQGGLRIAANTVIDRASLDSIRVIGDLTFTDNSAALHLSGNTSAVSRPASFKGGLSLNNVNIEGTLHISNVQAKDISAAETQVKGPATISAATSESIYLKHVVFDHGLSLHSVTCQDAVAFDEVTVQRDLSVFQVAAVMLHLTHTKIAGGLEISGSLTGSAKGPRPIEHHALVLRESQ